MKPARLVVLGVAGLAAAAAALLMSQTPEAPPPVVQKAPVETKEILVAAAELPVGNTIKKGELRWQPWPSEFLPAGAVTRSDAPEGLAELDGAIVRVALMNGEPVRREKLIRANSNAFMSAILPSGMRAIAITIDPSSAAGGFVLPNDRVDILKVYREDDGGKGGDSQSAETILRNIRVLAIGQSLEDKAGEKVATGSTATLEVTPSQAELLSLAQKTGVLSLALRSLTDAGQTENNEMRAAKDDASLTLVRYGVSRQAARR